MILRANALNLPLEDESVDLIITSPPYFALRSYRDGDEHYDGQIGSEPTPKDFLEALWAATREMVRVLKPTGSIFVNLGDKYAGTSGANGNTGLGMKDDKRGAIDPRQGPRNNFKQTSGFVPAKSLMGLPWRYAIGCVDELGLILRRDLIWFKPRAMPESAKDRPSTSHEYWFMFVKNANYFYDIDEIREPYASSSEARSLYASSPMPGRSSTPGEKRTEFQDWKGPNPRGRVPGSVWTVNPEPVRAPKALGVGHFAAFPQEFPRRMILAWSPPGGVVLDPFGGTGTVAMVAESLGRTGISVDLSADYCRLAKWRIEESGHRVKSEQRTWAERQGELAV